MVYWNHFVRLSLCGVGVGGLDESPVVSQLAEGRITV